MSFTSPSGPRKPLCCGQSRRPSRPHLHDVFCLFVCFYGASCQLCILQGRLPQELPRPTGGASNPLQPGAGVIAGTRRAHGGVDLRRILAPLCPSPLGPARGSGSEAAQFPFGQGSPPASPAFCPLSRLPFFTLSDFPGSQDRPHRIHCAKPRF